MESGLLAIFWLAALLLFIVLMIVALRHNKPGVGLKQRFEQLGVLRGRSRTEVIGRVGPPSAVRHLADGGTLLEWQAPGYHIGLTFDADNVCSGVTHDLPGHHASPSS